LLEDGWRDTHVAIYGPAIEGLRSVFESNWREHADEEADDGYPFPTPEPAGRELVATLKSEGGDGVESSIARAYREAFDKANRTIWITQAYFVPDDALMSTLERAAALGVDVRLIVPGVSDSGTVLNASRYFYRQLMDAGIKLYENRRAFVHAKTAVIDGVWSTVGSSNLDMRSFVHNDEVNAIVIGADFGRQMERQFEKDLEDCVAIDPAQWAERPITDKVKERLARLVAYWL
jgi:cardiolipin synthase